MKDDADPHARTEETMRAFGTWNLSLLVGLVLVSPAAAQTFVLAESPREGDCFRCSTETSLTGVLKVTRDNKQLPIRIAAKNEHAFIENVLSVDRNGVRRSARHYSNAVSRAKVDGDTVNRTLSPDRRLIVAQRTGDSLFCYSPVGPLTRSELEVVSEHFDTLHLTGILPGRAVSVGDTWKLAASTVQSLCLFDGLISHELSAKLESATAGKALIQVTGTAKGIENGALANLTIDGTVTFDLARTRIVAVTWKQKDVRDQGPVTPAAEVETTTNLKRELLDGPPAELGKEALARVPAADDPPAAMKQLVHTDAKGRYQLLHSRDWHVVGQTEHHLVMRLLDRGDFVAQLTLTSWQSARAGKHMTPDDFHKLIAAAPNWTAEEVTDRGEVPTDAVRLVYRVVARGELDGSKVVQNFYVVAGPRGDQVIATFTMKPGNATRLGTHDLAVVNAIDFPKK